MAKPLELPWQLQLGGTGKFVPLCHRDPWQCPTCIQRIAQRLAAELKYERWDALQRPLTSYQAEFDAGACSVAQAEGLRMLVADVCGRQRGLRGFEHVVIVDDSYELALPPKPALLLEFDPALVPAGLPRGMKVAMWWVAFGLLCVGAVS